MQAILLLTVVLASAYAATIPPVPPCNKNAALCRFDELGHNIKYTTINLGNELEQVGLALLDATIGAATDLVVEGSKAVVGTVYDHLSAVGKRNAASAIFDIAAKGKQYIETVGDGLKAKLSSSIDGLVDISNKVSSLNVADAIKSDVDNIVGDFKTSAATSVVQIKTGLTSTVYQMIGKAQQLIGGQKRGISDALSATANAVTGALKSVTDALTPHVQTVVNSVTDLGQQVIDQTTVLVDSVKTSANELNDKLTDHKNDLVQQGNIIVQHGKDAIDASKDAVSQIASQTLENVVGTVVDASKTASDAVGVVVDHISGGY